MKQSIPITKENIQAVATFANSDVDTIQKMIVKSEKEYQKEQDKKWAIQRLGVTTKWYDDALKKVEEIGKNLPKDIKGKERLIKQYGPIADSLPALNLSLPLINDEKYARASSIEMIMNNPSLYLKVVNWD